MLCFLSIVFLKYQCRSSKFFRMTTDTTGALHLLLLILPMQYEGGFRCQPFYQESD